MALLFGVLFLVLNLFLLNPEHQTFFISVLHHLVIIWHLSAWRMVCDEFRSRSLFHQHIMKIRLVFLVKHR